MTGSKCFFCCAALLLLAAAPACAQLPNATDTGPDAARPPGVSAPEPDTAPIAVSSGPKLPPTLDVRFSQISGPLARPQYDAVRVTYGGELTLSADRADADLSASRYDLRGSVRVHEADTTLRAEEVVFGGPKSPAVATDAQLTRSYYTIRAPRIVATPELITAYNGDFTTVPDGAPADYYLRAQTITLDAAAHRGTLRNATLYLFHTRLLTVPRLTFGYNKAGGPAQRRAMIPTIGVSSRYGTFIAFGQNSKISRFPVQYRLLLPTRSSVEALVTSSQTLYTPPARSSAVPAPYAGPTTLLDRLRAAATVPPGQLPEGDPLRFQDFLPEPNPIQLFNGASHGGLYLGENLLVHAAASGRRRNDLYVSRLPEVTLSGDLPLSRVPADPVYGNPSSFRSNLHHIVLYLQAQETVGDYREQLSSAPYSIRARRNRSQIGLTTRPLLVGTNTVLLPSILSASSSYSGSKSAYRYSQINVAVNHYFSDLTAVGVQFLASSTSGDSPFNFDVLDTSREMDLRFQIGTPRLVVAGRVRYDLSRGGVIDYQAALGPALRGFIPVFSYNFRTRSIGLDIQVKGLTF